MKLERLTANSFIFKDVNDEKVLYVVEYPTKQKQGWYFWIIYDNEKYELDIPKKERLEIIGEVRNVNPSNLWEDNTDWNNMICR